MMKPFPFGNPINALFGQPTVESTVRPRRSGSRFAKQNPKGTLIARFVAVLVASVTVTASAELTQSINQLGRILGVGWSSGFHACKASDSCCCCDDLPPRPYVAHQPNASKSWLWGADRYGTGCDQCQRRPIANSGHFVGPRPLNASAWNGPVAHSGWLSATPGTDYHGPYHDSVHPLPPSVLSRNPQQHALVGPKNADAKFGDKQQPPATKSKTEGGSQEQTDRKPTNEVRLNQPLPGLSQHPMQPPLYRSASSKLKPRPTRLGQSSESRGF